MRSFEGVTPCILVGRFKRFPERFCSSGTRCRGVLDVSKGCGAFIFEGQGAGINGTASRRGIRAEPAEAYVNWLGAGVRGM